eukprot:13337780-Alexandrium_andersonii.AAC.1
MTSSVRDGTRGRGLSDGGHLPGRHELRKLDGRPLELDELLAATRRRRADLQPALLAQGLGL